MKSICVVKAMIVIESDNPVGKKDIEDFARANNINLAIPIHGDEPYVLRLYIPAPLNLPRRRR